MTLEQLIDAEFLGYITTHELITGLRQRFQALVAPPPTGLSDQEFESAYSDYSEYVRRALWARGCPNDLLEDMAAETWMKVWEQRREYDPARSSLATFIGFCARTVMGDHWRGQEKAPPTVLLPDSFSDDVQDEAFSLPGNAAAIDLRHDLAAVLTATDLELLPLLEEGLSPAEIANRLGLKAKTVRNRLYDLRQRVSKYISSHGSHRPCFERYIS